MPPAEPNPAVRASVKDVLCAFVGPWNLPLNPEDLDAIAYCVLRYGLDPSLSPQERIDASREAIREVQERWDALRQHLPRRSDGRS